MTQSPPERVPVLDGLRGIAILMVLFFHATIVGTQTPPEALLHGVFRNFGWAGVDLFFVLSGFLITGLLLDAKGEPGALGNFYARRVLRIFPVYYGFLVLLFLLEPRLAPGTLSVGDDAIWYWLYLQNFATAAAGDWTHSRFLNLFWSLAIEEQFYLVWPWLVLACRRSTLARLCLGAIALSLATRVVMVAAHASPITIYVLTPARLDGLAAGAWVALAVRGAGGAAALAAPARRIGLACAVGVCILVLWQRGFSYMLPGTATAGLTLVAIGFASLLVVALNAAPGGWWERLLAGRTLRLFGRTSYALYVIHQVVLIAATTLLVRHVFEPYAPDASLLALQLALYPVAIGASLLLALASWRFYEAPILGLKRHFPRGSGKRSESSGVA